MPVQVRIWLGKDEGGTATPPVEDPDAVLGLALYRETGDRVRVLGEELHETAELHGHTWRVDAVHEGSPGDSRFEVTLPAAEDARLVEFVVTGLGKDHHYLVGGVEGGERSGWDSSVGTSSSRHGSFLVLPGRDRVAQLRVLEGATSDTTIAAVVSVRAD